MNKNLVPGRIIPPKRPREVDGGTIEVKTGCGSIFVSVTRDSDGYPLEVFCTGDGSCLAASMSAVGRVTSIALRCGVNPMLLAKQLQEARCTNVSWDNKKMVPSCFAGIGQVIEEITERAAEKSGNSEVDDAPSDDDPEMREAIKQTRKLAKEREEQGLNE